MLLVLDSIADDEDDLNDFNALKMKTELKKQALAA
jgi:hypothetical protein